MDKDVLAVGLRLPTERVFEEDAGKHTEIVHAADEEHIYEGGMPNSTGRIVGWGLSSEELADSDISSPRLLRVSPVRIEENDRGTASRRRYGKVSEHRGLSSGLHATGNFDTNLLCSKLRLRSVASARTQLAVVSTTAINIPLQCLPTALQPWVPLESVEGAGGDRQTKRKPEQPREVRRPTALLNLPEYPDEGGGPERQTYNGGPHNDGAIGAAGTAAEVRLAAAGGQDRSRTGTGSSIGMQLSSPVDGSFTSFFGKPFGRENSKGNNMSSELSLGLTKKVSSGALDGSNTRGAGRQSQPPSSPASVMPAGSRSVPGAASASGSGSRRSAPLEPRYLAVSRAQSQSQSQSPFHPQGRPPSSPSLPPYLPPQRAKVKPLRRVGRLSPEAPGVGQSDSHYRLCPAEILVPCGEDLHLFRSGYTRSQSAFRGRRDSGRPAVTTRWRSDQFAGAAGGGAARGPGAGAGGGSSPGFNWRLENDGWREGSAPTSGQGRWRREAATDGAGARGEGEDTAPLRPLFLLRLPGAVWPWLLRREEFLRKLRKFLGLATLVLVRFDVNIGS